MSASVAARKTKIEDKVVDVEGVTSDEEADEGHVHDENCSHGHHQQQHDGQSARVIGRKERAARKEIARSATLKPVPHIKRVTFKRHNGPVFAISNAEVYYDTTSGSYIVYGQPMVETNGLDSQAAAAQRMAAEQSSTPAPSKVTIQDDDDSEADGADDKVDASGLDEKDIAIVMDQAHVSRAKAIKALLANGNDIVNTIMELTM